MEHLLRPIGLASKLRIVWGLPAWRSSLKAKIVDLIEGGLLPVILAGIAACVFALIYYVSPSFFALPQAAWCAASSGCEAKEYVMIEASAAKESSWRRAYAALGRQSESQNEMGHVMSKAAGDGLPMSLSLAKARGLAKEARAYLASRESSVELESKELKQAREFMAALELVRLVGSGAEPAASAKKAWESVAAMSLSAMDADKASVLGLLGDLEKAPTRSDTAWDMAKALSPWSIYHGVDPKRPSESSMLNEWHFLFGLSGCLVMGFLAFFSAAMARSMLWVVRSMEGYEREIFTAWELRKINLASPRDKRRPSGQRQRL